MNPFSFLFGGHVSDELPNLFPLAISPADFLRIDIINIYTKILTDVIERSDGLSEDDEASLWDNCLAGESSHGLIHRLARAMFEKNELFLVYDQATKVLRKATSDEESKIRADYAKQAESTIGVYISFKMYHRTDMVKLYSELEYVAVGALNKSMNVSKAVQFKINDLRSTVGAADSSVAKAQAQKMADGLKNGRDVMLDGKDTIETAKPDLTATNSAMEFLNEKRAGYLNMPCSYITGELNSGLGDSGNADARAIERGLKSYFVSIIKPVCNALYDVDLDFKSEDYDQIDSAVNTLKVFELIGEELMTKDNQRQIINKLFGLDPDEPGGPKDEPLPPQIVLPPGPNNNPNPAIPTKGA